MAIELRAAGHPGVRARYFGWAPVRCQLRDPGRASAIDVVVSQRRTASAGKLRFGKTWPTDDRVRLRLPGGGQAVAFSVAGEFGKPSARDGDVTIVVEDAQGRELATQRAMVRVRKNANALRDGERDRLLRAFAQLNDRGAGAFKSFRESHSLATVDEAHGNAAFLPWHRAFLLDLERELQRIDPSVALPYWRFDRPARKVFSADFMGARDASGVARLSPTNPLIQWTTDGRLGIDRLPLFNPSQRGGFVIGERPVVRFTGAFADLPQPFEIDPHGQAHTSFNGFIQDLETAARDPLFYLLHCNVDRLWAKWQWLHKRMRPTSGRNFGFDGTTEGQRPPGHNLDDTMWPWNNVTAPPRPSFAPRHPFRDGVGVDAPSNTPRVREMIDYQGMHDPGARLGFDYDDVPFDP